ncbi:hypothetical protein AUJ65_06285 [Candidatus Micrarchaeota archaeon CG1_02_51_15]|nr:MAG: hypothetical protein AUJ65_06285 [Candidatus Micrarchaeota archaeon CG1_02_51_15]
MEHPIILLTGRSAVGKSTLSPALARELEARTVNASEMMRERARLEGYAHLADFFKHTGVKPAFENLRPHVLREIKKHAENGPVVVEGVYDSGLYELLKSSFPADRLLIVNVTANRSFRQAMHAHRKQLTRKDSKANLRKRNQVKVQAGLPEIIAGARLSVRNAGNFDALLTETVRKIREHFQQEQTP